MSVYLSSTFDDSKSHTFLHIPLYILRLSVPSKKSPCYTNLILWEDLDPECSSRYSLTKYYKNFLLSED